jgi:hypothetical protein
VVCHGSGEVPSRRRPPSRGIQARTCELLTVMVLMEALFGIAGVVASPLYYAWAMGLLRDAEWV